jgi:hypothetical protein
MRGLSGSKGRDEIEERRAVVGEVLAGLRADGLEPSSDMLRDVERLCGRPDRCGRVCDSHNGSRWSALTLTL